MASDLVSRLRRWADTGDMGRKPDPSDLRRQAADIIERYEAAITDRKAIYQTKLDQAVTHERDSLDYSRCDLFRHAVEAFECLEDDIKDALRSQDKGEG